MSITSSITSIEKVVYAATSVRSIEQTSRLVCNGELQ
jgi:hypothetical protein